MDGFYREPIKQDTNERFLSLPLDKYLLTPHTAYNFIDAVKEMERMILESIDDVINNKETIRNRVNL